MVNPSYEQEVSTAYQPYAKARGRTKAPRFLWLNLSSTIGPLPT
jgi:hypothetical protein